MEKAKYCLVCGEKAVDDTYGYTWCEKHKKYNIISPESLEILVMWRLEGRTIQDMENRLNHLLTVYS